MRISGDPASAVTAHLLTPMRPASAQPERTAGGLPSEYPAEDPLSVVLAADNPLLEAAGPLLRALAELPDLVGLNNHEDVESLREVLIRDMRQFQQISERAGFRREHTVAARYCLCTALDEAANRMPWARDGGWAADSLLVLFHNEVNGGEKFFLLLGRMAQAPAEHIQVLELLYHLLSLGFKGRYSLLPDGDRQLETIHRRLLGLLQEYGEPMPAALSPHQKGVSGGAFRFMRFLPVWVTASILAALLLVLHSSLRRELTPSVETLTRQLATLAVQPAPEVFALAPEPPLDAWFTAEERRNYGLVVDAPHKRLSLSGSRSFVSGAVIHERMAPVLDTIAHHLIRGEGAIVIIGHTDTVRLRAGSAFRDNQHLSEERAKAVAAALVARGVPADRITTSGKGDREPVTSNDTENGRARNRRVDVIVP